MLKYENPYYFSDTLRRKAIPQVSGYLPYLPLQVIRCSVTSLFLIKVHYAHKTVCNCIEILLKSYFYFTFVAKAEIRKHGRYPARYHRTPRTRDIMIRETDQESNSSNIFPDIKR